MWNMVADRKLAPTKLRNNTSAASAETASRIRTRPSATRTRSMCVAIRGHARRSLDTTGLSTTRPTGLEKLTPVATAATNSHGLDAVLARECSAAAMRLDTPQTRIGTSGSSTCKRCTSLGNATRPRSFTVRTTSDSISSTATQARAASGPTCLRTPV